MRNKYLLKLAAVGTVAMTLLSVSGGTVSASHTTKPERARTTRVAHMKKGRKGLKRTKRSKRAKKSKRTKHSTKRSKKAKRSAKARKAKFTKFLYSFYQTKNTVKVNRKNIKAIKSEYHPLGNKYRIHNRETLRIFGERSVKNGKQYIFSFKNPRKSKSYAYLQVNNKGVRPTKKTTHRAKRGLWKNLRKATTNYKPSMKQLLVMKYGKSKSSKVNRASHLYLAKHKNAVKAIKKYQRKNHISTIKNKRTIRNKRATKHSKKSYVAKNGDLISYPNGYLVIHRN